MDMNIDQSRRKLIKVAWATPVVLSVTLPAHAQTSITTDLVCTITADQNTIAAGGTITGIQTTVSPPTPGIVLLCTPTTTDPANPTLATATATTDAAGVAIFPTLVAAVAVGTVITLTDSLDVSDTSGLTLTPCTVTITVT